MQHSMQNSSICFNVRGEISWPTFWLLYPNNSSKSANCFWLHTSVLTARLPFVFHPGLFFSPCLLSPPLYFFPSFLPLLEVIVCVSQTVSPLTKDATSSTFAFCRHLNTTHNTPHTHYSCLSNKQSWFFFVRVRQILSLLGVRKGISAFCDLIWEHILVEKRVQKGKKA